MSRIDGLIADLAPEGVEFKALGDLVSYEQPAKYLVTSTRYNDGFQTPVLTAGQTFVLGYTDETDGICAASPTDPVIIFDDFTTAFHWVDFPFKAKSSAMKILRPRPGISADFKFIYYAMRCIGFEPQEHGRYWISRYSTFRVPMPPPEIQREVVRILDELTELEEELKKGLNDEIEARRRQYEHHRRQVLSHNADRATVADWPRLETLVSFTNGKPHEQFVVDDGTVALITSRFVSTGGRSARYTDEAHALSPARVGDVAMVMSDLPNGKALARCYYVESDGRYTANQRVCLLRVLDEGLVDPRFLYHFLNRTPQLLRYDNGQYQTHLKKGDVLGVRVPALELDEQRYIADVLGALDGAINDLCSRLSMECEARRQQYEHTRDRLLTFDEAIA